MLVAVLCPSLYLFTYPMTDTSFLHFSFFSPLNSLEDEIDMLERLWLSGICHNDKIEVSLFTLSPVFSFRLILTIYAEPW